MPPKVFIVRCMTNCWPSLKWGTPEPRNGRLDREIQLRIGPGQKGKYSTSHRLKELEAQNKRLKRIVADQLLGMEILQEALEKKL